ncbi:MAG: dihydroxyacetone kinase subunit DhaL [Treponema sp.]
MNEEQFIRWMKAYAAELQHNKEQLTALDSAIGDGDHGLNMDRGFQAVLAKLEASQTGGIGGIAKIISSTLISTVGGASGPLYGTFFLKIAAALTGKTECTAQEFAAALEKGCGGIQALGKAQQWDKTMLDTFIPAVTAFKQTAESGESFSACLKAAEQAAKTGMEATIPLVAKKGRASYLGERSAGHQDPGATSAYLLFKTAAENV